MTDRNANQGSAGENPRCRLYLVSPPVVDVQAFAPALEAALDGGDVAAFQLRLKGPDGITIAGDDDVRRAADLLCPLVQDRDVAFMLNDSPALALETGCDGAHIGKDDMSLAQARALAGDALMLGVSCYDSRHRAMEAGEQGADYVAFGPFFPSPTKDNYEAMAPVELVEWWASMMEIPACAIGGLTPENCRPVVAAGIDFLATVSAVWDHPEGPAAGVRAFNDVFDQVAAGKS